MTRRSRAALATASVCAVAAVVIVSLALGPRANRGWQLLPGLVAVALSISSVVAEPRELLGAMVFGAGPVMGLAAAGSPSWLIGPLAVLLLVGGELNALSWEVGGGESAQSDGSRRIVNILRLAGLGLVASLAVGVAARLPLLDGFVAVGMGAAALAGLAWMILPGGSRPSA